MLRDLDYHAQRCRAFERFLREPVTFKADREAETSGRHFVEFYDHGRPSQTGLLCVPHRMWTVDVGGHYFSATVEALRFWCYTRWAQRSGPVRGGDDQAFWGVLFPLSRFGLLSRERLTDMNRAWVRLQTERLLVTPAPVAAPETLSLFAVGVSADEADDGDEDESE